MGQTFTRLFDSLFGNREMRVVMLGLDAAGERVCSWLRRPRHSVAHVEGGGPEARVHTGCATAGGRHCAPCNQQLTSWPPRVHTLRQDNYSLQAAHRRGVWVCARCSLQQAVE
jgi:hypothetical protein